jgi:predicted RNase H-like HicB family nuclease
MRVELTAVFEPQPDGWIAASVAEVRGALTQGRTLEEARAMLKDALQMILESYREQALAEAAPDARVERITIDLPEAARVMGPSSPRIAGNDQP